MSDGFVPRRSQRTRRSRYHHGNLHAALLAAGVHILRRKGVAGLTLRAAARAAGVSQAAPYKHFRDKEALLAAVAESGFVLLYERCAAALARASEPRARLRQLGKAYVHFALEEPAMFRLMFGAELAGLKSAHAGPGATGARVFDTMRQAVDAILQPAGASSAQRRIACFGAWSLVHGLALLLIDRRLDVSARETAGIIDGITAQFVSGLGPAASR